MKKLQVIKVTVSDGQITKLMLNGGITKEPKIKLWKHSKSEMLFSYKNNIYTIPRGDGSYEPIFQYNKLDRVLEKQLANSDLIINVKSSDTAETTINVQKKNTKDVFHKEYNTIQNCINLDIPVYLYGPAGSGKNHTLLQIAKELKLDFYFTNSIQQEFKITGFIDAGGNYHETEFFKAFTNGGLFFLDEMDASIPEVLVLLNAAIANKYFEFPCGRFDAHENFRVVAAGNTLGTGANEQYTGRLVLDQATLDRFVCIEFDYDKNIEMLLANGNKDLVNFIRDLRKVSDKIGVRTTFSYRCITSVSKLEQTKMELEKILNIAVFKGLDSDTINTIKGAFTETQKMNKYFQALENNRTNGGW